MKRKNKAGSPDITAYPLVRLQSVTRCGRVPAAARFMRWAQAAAPGHAGVLTIRLVGVVESQRLNEGFRGKHGPTNVLAFPAGCAPAVMEAELGDLVICLPLVLREAREQGKKPFDHLAHLVVHGTLHLIGHDHDRAAKARRMENAEVRILRGLGVGNPYRVQTPGRVRRRTTT